LCVSARRGLTTAAHSRQEEFVVLRSTEKSREYSRLAAENDKRAAETANPELKAIFLELASEYRDLAELIEDPEQWRARLRDSAASRPLRL
jgi:hypothetical protein